MKQIAKHNLNACDQIIQTCVHLGVRKFCLSPGNRSAPFALAIAKHPLVDTTVHIDERGMAFYALGYSKANAFPAATLTTSGTAALNTLPAVAESYYSNVPMLIFCADRPFKHQDIFANQSINQSKAFEGLTLKSFDLPLPHSSEEMDSFLAKLSYGIHLAIHQKGPVHFNIRIKEPLFAKQTQDFALKSVSFTKYASPHIQLSDEAFEYLMKRCETAGIILVGSNVDPKASLAIKQFAMAFDFPIIKDVQANIENDLCLNCSTYFLQYGYQHLPNKPKVIVQFGDRFTDKSWYMWIKEQKCDHIIISDNHHLIDPSLSASYRIHVQAEKLLDKFVEKDPLPQIDIAQQIDRHIANIVSSFESDFWELSLCKHLQDIFPNMALFLGNSTVIRLFNLFYTQNNVYANRGCSGIDGNIASICGISDSLKKPLLAVIGDVTAAHDLSSLPLLSKAKHPILLFIIDNGGGAIFSRFPIRNEQEVFNKYFLTPPNVAIEDIARLAQLDYVSISSIEKLDSLSFLKNHMNSCIIHIKIPYERTESYLTTLCNSIDKSLQNNKFEFMTDFYAKNISKT